MNIRKEIKTIEDAILQLERTSMCPFLDDFCPDHIDDGMIGRAISIDKLDGQYLKDNYCMMCIEKYFLDKEVENK